MMKRVLTALLSTALICSMFAGCSSSAGTSSADSAAPATDAAQSEAAAPEAEASAESGDTAEGGADVNEDGTVNNPEDVVVDENDLVLWSLFSGGDGSFMDQIVADYNAQTSGRKVTSIMLVWADYYTKLATAVAANKGPDIGISHISKLPELVAQGVVIPFDSYAETAGTVWSDYDASIIESVTFDGEKYALPLDTHAEIMYFNKDVLETAGVAVDANGRVDFGSGEAGFKAVLDTVKASLPEGSSPISLPSKGDDPYRVWWATYFQMGGTPLVSEDGASVTMDPAIAEKAMDFVKSLYDEGYVLPGIEDHGKYFQGGTAAFFFGGTWTTGAFEESGINFGAQAYPNIFENPACWADSHTMIIPFNKNRDEEKTQGSVDFITYASATGGLTWAKSGQIPSNNTVLASEEYKALPFRSDYAEAAKVAVYPSANENFYTIKDLLIKNLDNVWNGTSTSADTVQSIIGEMETAIA